MPPTLSAAQAGTATATRQLACLVVEAQTLVAQLLAAVLRTTPGLGGVTVATTVADAVAEAAERDLDLVILDHTLPDGDGQAVLKAIAAWHREASCIVLTGGAHEFSCPSELARQIVAVIRKTEPFDTFQRAVEAVVRQRLGSKQAPRQAAPPEALRPRELEVFEMIGKGMSTKKIAESLGISVHTVNSHRKAISSKLGAVGAELVRQATLYRATRPADSTPASSQG